MRSCDEVNELAASTLRGRSVGRHAVLHFLTRTDVSVANMGLQARAVEDRIYTGAGTLAPAQWAARYWEKCAPPDEIAHAARHLDRLPSGPVTQVTLRLGQHAFELLRLVPGSVEIDDDGWPLLNVPTRFVSAIVHAAVGRMAAAPPPRTAPTPAAVPTPWRDRDLLDDYYESRAGHRSLWELERLPGFHHGGE